MHSDDDNDLYIDDNDEDHHVHEDGNDGDDDKKLARPPTYATYVHSSKKKAVELGLQHTPTKSDILMMILIYNHDEMAKMANMRW